MRSFDAIIGAGQAGPALPGRLSEAGQSAAIVERHLAGGTCVNTGCRPMKALVARVYAIHTARRAAAYGFSIAGPTAKRIAVAGFRKVGLLGTAFTMEHDFYKGHLTERYGLEVIIAQGEDRATVHRIIYDELVAGCIEPSSREAFQAVIARLVDAGAQAVILGCTEIMLLVGQEDSSVPIFDTTAIHAAAALDQAPAIDGVDDAQRMADGAAEQ